MPHLTQGLHPSKAQLQENHSQFLLAAINQTK